MTFTVGRQTYAVQSECIVDMLGRCSADTRPLPNGPRAVPRTARWSPPENAGESRVLPLIDLARHLRALEGLMSPRPIILVITNGTHTTGLMVDTINGVASIPVNAVRSIPALHEQIDGTSLRGIVTRPEGVMTMLDVDALLADAASGLAASGHPV